MVVNYMRNIYTVSSSSASTSYGNIMTFVKEKIISELPIIHFNDVNMTSEIAYVNVRRRIGRNNVRELNKLERPYMSIAPQISVPNGDQYLYDIPLTNNLDSMEMGIQSTTLFPIIINKDDEYTMLYKLNRDRIRFEITITVDTHIQQIDLYKYMVNFLTWDRPFAVSTSLEAMIPREIIKHAGFLSNINIDDEEKNQIPIILKMLNRWSAYPITYKIRNGTALDEFFMYYNAEVLIKYSDLEIETVSRKNFADDYAQIRFSCEVDFNLPGLFVLAGDKPKPRELDVDLEVKEHDGYHDLIPLFTINNFFSKYPLKKDGFVYYISARFKTDCKDGETVDKLDLSELIEPDKVRTISKYRANAIPLETLIDVIMLKEGVNLPKEDWDINWGQFELTIRNADNQDTYCIVIYINNNLFMEEAEDVIEDMRHD